MGILIGSIVLISAIAAGTVVVLNKKDSNEINVLKDFYTIKKALIKYKQENKVFTNQLTDLKEYLDDDLEGDYSKYEISNDYKFLIVQNEKSQNYVKKVGGDSYIKFGNLYLAFSSSKSTNDHVKAVITIKPSDQIYTTTTLTYSYENSVAEGSKIVDAEWSNKKRRFPKPGVHVVKLRVQNAREEWSEWVSKEIEVKEKRGIKKVVAGGENLSIVKRNGKMSVLGKNQFGLLGMGTIKSIDELEENTQTDNIKDYLIGENHSLILTYDGHVYASGKNTYGQLGIGNRMDSYIFKKCKNLYNIKSIAIGKDISGALDTQGRIYTWGLNEDGQLGYNDEKYVEEPKMIQGVDKIKKLSLGENHGLALLYDGTILSWGSNTYGELGLGYKSGNCEPSISELSNIIDVVASNEYSLAITENHRVIGFGRNDEHQLGTRGEKYIVEPKEILGMKNIIKVDSCRKYSLALTDSGNVYVFGKLYLRLEPYEVPTEIPHIKYVKEIQADVKNAFMYTDERKLFYFDSKISKLKEVILLSEQ